MRVSQCGFIFQMCTRFLRKTCFASAPFHRVVYLLWGLPLSTDVSISSNLKGIWKPKFIVWLFQTRLGVSFVSLATALEIVKSATQHRFSP